MEINVNAIEMFKENVITNKDRIIKACTEYKEAKAIEDDIIAKQEKIQQDILNEYVFMADPEICKRFEEEPKRITRPFDTYQMGEARFNEFLDMCYEKYVVEGIANPKGKGWVCEEFAKKDRQIKEDTMLDMLRDVVPLEAIDAVNFVKMRQHWKYREKLINMAMYMMKLEAIVNG